MLIHLKTLGCRLNEAELETWAQAFQRSGHQVTREISDAHVVIVNSCAVTNDAARKSRNLIRRIHRENPRAKLVVSGCYATLNADEAASLMGVDLVVSNADKDQLVSKTLSELNLGTMPVLSTDPGEISLFTRGRQRAFVKVQDGCRYRCTFCIVTVARGEEKSRPISQIIEEINELYRQGIDEVVLTGVHLGGYGSDLGYRLSDLIADVLKETPVPRLRLGSLEPWEFTDDFFNLFENPRLMPHLHLPLQSGSDSVLKRMSRRCKTDDYSAIVRRLRAQVPDINLTSDIIVGFPGETEQEWQESLKYIEKTGFGDLHIFSYSSRTGTKAAALPHPVDEPVKKQRSRELHQLAEKLKRNYLSEQVGKRFPVLWEGHSEVIDRNSKRVFGYTPNYIRVACVIDTNESIENRILDVELKEVNGHFVEASLQQTR